MNVNNRRVLLFGCLSLLLAPAQTAAHESQPNSHIHNPETRHGHADFIIGVKGVYTSALAEGEHIPHGGFGVSVAKVIISEWLAIEAGIKLMFSSHATHLPIEIALRKPFDFGPYHLSLGIGPVFEPGFHDDETHIALGGGFGIEGAYWYRPWGGFMVGAGYELKYSEGIIHEWVTMAGPLFGW